MHSCGQQEFRQTIAEKAKLEEEVACQHDTIMSMQKKTANDQAVIEELTLQVGVLRFISFLLRRLYICRSTHGSLLSGSRVCGHDQYGFQPESRQTFAKGASCFCLGTSQIQVSNISRPLCSIPLAR